MLHSPLSTSVQVASVWLQGLLALKELGAFMIDEVLPVPIEVDDSISQSNEPSPKNNAISGFMQPVHNS